ncbi:molybdenum cofactor biosynthesis protein MoaE [Synechococcus sp. BA-132 BA5]|uniref:molybdenum cofactor biosynthesis protein MoaE n=1 Tax=Synechococcus sp. BA-132 BA5 TaxID=3110252 RepID=UPI002B213504|nr:molybdenum cofactor biosynthesis protein MoaE [Synechococcus sp. BA-132 BA5]MEA5415323.1 molybdenum cofactor biosynthesis protein MoaE [Synechococcus sp. BA-132 BA5]
MPIPSPSGPIAVQLLEAPFEPLELLATWQRSLGAAGTAAESHFIGRVRPTTTAAGEPLEALELEHYPGMSEAQLRTLAEACAARHGVGAVLVAHRVGRIAPGEAIVLVAVQADRRGPALRCVQELLEDLKHHAPFWKREWSGGSGTWVAGNTPL